MHMDLRTITIEPLRQTFGHLARRMGADKPASRYLEGTMDLQPVENFHYRPTWDPEHEIFDPALTCIVMKDWYALKDPRQFYYGTWVLARARMQETAGADFDLVEEQGFAASYPPEGKRLINRLLLPLRHVAWGASMNNAYVAAYSYGIAISQAAAYASMDQLGIAQYITRLALAFDEIDALEAARKDWLEAPAWQGLRRWIEDQMVMKDWFELLVAQNYVLEGLMFPLIYERFVPALDARHGAVISMLTRFQRAWSAESAGWIDSVIKTAAAESEDNRRRIAGWVAQAKQRATEALEPVAILALGADADAAMAGVTAQFDARVVKAGVGA